MTRYCFDADLIGDSLFGAQRHEEEAEAIQLLRGKPARLQSLVEAGILLLAAEAHDENLALVRYALRGMEEKKYREERSALSHEEVLDGITSTYEMVNGRGGTVTKGSSPWWRNYARGSAL